MPRKTSPQAAKTGAQRQREYRQRHAAGRLNIVIDPAARQRLDQLAKSLGMTLRETLETMINSPKKIGSEAAKSGKKSGKKNGAITQVK
ncbi:hypothetical protein [Allopusillimonas ginsengisoli]|uniref:hypothetical protein n=1 Tax=Allopusillimonas ginsengisoli TaxID=453575 RepID=UPI0010206083|nr:hypothetical protein [Allopusillimonas ginsengisoli]TEA79480.1 hypothetical protein ERE07_00520 [Allopusillimonas ginsengisoli]